MTKVHCTRKNNNKVSINMKATNRSIEKSTFKTVIIILTFGTITSYDKCLPDACTNFGSAMPRNVAYYFSGTKHVKTKRWCIVCAMSRHLSRIS